MFKKKVTVSTNLDLKPIEKRVTPEDMKEFVEPMFDVYESETEEEHNNRCEAYEGM